MNTSVFARFIAFLFSPVLVWGQGVVTTFSGADFLFPSAPVSRAEAPILSPQTVAVDGAGNLYISSIPLRAILKVDADGSAVRAFAGNGIQNFTGDGGDARAASLSFPRGLTIDGNGNVYFFDSGRIRRVAPDGIITTYAGGGGNAGENVPRLQASITANALAVDGMGNVYFAEGRRVRRINTAGIVTTVAGALDPATTTDADGPALRVRFDAIDAIACDAQGVVYIAHQIFNAPGRIRRLTADGMITTVAGGGTRPPDEAPTARDAVFFLPSGIAIAADGTLYFSDRGLHAIFRVTPQGRIFRLAGDGNSALSGDNSNALRASFSTPFGIALDRQGNLFVADTNNHRIRVIDASGVIRTYAGTEGFIGEGGSAQFARLSGATYIALDRNNRLIISERNNHRIRRVNDDGTIQTIAGTGRGGGPPNAVATQRAISPPQGVAVDSANNVYFISDSTVFRVTPEGAISNAVGEGPVGFSGDGGAAIAARLGFPNSLFIDSANSIYIGDRLNFRVRKVTAGVIRTIAGTGESGFSGDGGPATQARITEIRAIAVDSEGNVYLADLFNHRIRKIDRAGVITTFAGNGRSGTAGDGGPAAAAEIGSPLGLAFDEAGTLYVSSNHRIRRISRDGIVTTYAGAGRPGFSGDGGSALTASFNNPSTLVVGPQARLFVADDGNDRVRVITPGRGPSIVLSQKGLTFTESSGGSASAVQAFNVVNGGEGTLLFGLSTSTTSGGAWLSASLPPGSGTSVATGSISPAIQVSVNPSALGPGAYYGQVEVRAAGAANSPQMVTVVLNVLGEGARHQISVQPSGIIVTAAAGTANPGAPRLTLTTSSPAAIAFNSTASFGDGRAWFSSVPATGSIRQGQPVTIEIRPNISGFNAGVFDAALTFAFGNDTTRIVPIVLVVSPSGPVTANRRGADACTPARLVPVVTTLSPRFTVAAGWPSPVEVRVVDDCGAPLIDGAVTAAFSNGDPGLSLTSLRDGRWAATWQAATTASDVNVTVTARRASPDLTGSVQLAGNLGTNLDPPPAVAANGVLNAASFSVGNPLAPGSIVSIFGSFLAAEPASASSLPLATTLSSTRVILAGRSLPLIFVSPGQVNALIPFDLAVNSRHQVVIRRGNALSIPEPINVLPTQPAVFTKDSSGRGEAIVIAAYTDGSSALVSSVNPLKAGDVIVIYCTGLGDVEPRAVAGSATPANPLFAVTDPIRLTIGGVEARVLFAGLTPGFTGLYQINAVVPDGVAAANDVPLVVAQSSGASAAVSVSVR